MADWLVQVGELPSGVFLAVLGGVMMLDAIPLLGVLVPGDVAVLAAVGVGRPASLGAFLAVIAGCLGGWSLTFLAGRRFGARLRRSRTGAWIGQERWAAAERMLGSGGGRMVMVAPFLPVLNALLPLAAGGLRMSYRRFLGFAAVGAVLWAGLYMVLGLLARSVGGLLPGESFALLGTVGFGMLFGGLVLLGVRRRLASTVEG
ncbi:VTT domain-containing protein [Plantactinospora sp. B6F1]|uniref:VTT domain-containing protein n=1 Tax=Plantactinospora sp. B6F1 TaxID=3158971 RepID=UPI001A9233D4